MNIKQYLSKNRENIEKINIIAFGLGLLYEGLYRIDPQKYNNKQILLNTSLKNLSSPKDLPATISIEQIQKIFISIYSKYDISEKHMKDILSELSKEILTLPKTTYQMDSFISFFSFGENLYDDFFKYQKIKYDVNYIQNYIEKITGKSLTKATIYFLLKNKAIEGIHYQRQNKNIHITSEGLIFFKEHFEKKKK